MKQKFFIDFDDVMVQSTKAFCRVYHNRYKNHPDYIVPNYIENNDWNFAKQCPLLNQDESEIYDIFASEDFFNVLEPYHNCLEVLEKWEDKYDYYIVSIGTVGNLQRKLEYVDKHFPMIRNYIMMRNKGIKMDKSVIKMDFPNSIFIDDHQDNLFSVKVDFPIMFKGMGTKEWNNQWSGISCTNWEEVDGLLEMLYKGV